MNPQNTPPSSRRWDWLAYSLVPHMIGARQWLMGWDNINPEFNLALNIKRAVFAVWQEYQGVGLIGGMGHASDLPRLILFWILSWIVPLNLLRPLWVIAMLLVGVLGVYTLLYRRILPSILPHASAPQRAAAAFAGGAYALTNLATLQMFRTPFEPFVTHFGFLPWLLLFALDVIQKPNRKTILIFGLLSLLSSTQGYVQTVFLVYCMLLGVLSLGKPLKRLIIVWAITIAVNAYWLLPFGYFLARDSAVTVAAKINQMSTEEVYLRNRAVGTIADTITLKGFWFDTFDFNTQKDEILPIFSPWREYAQTPLVSFLLGAIFAVSVIGALYILLKRQYTWWWLPTAFLMVITMLTIDTPPFSWINDWLSSHIPLFYQAYRFRFTKFALAAGIIYSLLFGVGIAILIEKLLRHTKKASALVLGGVISINVVLIYPALHGQFLYGPIKVSFPSDYENMFAWFADKSKGRIANLPQFTYWGWEYYRWGYTGWGFLWYGIEDPIMDRAFDPWSAQNENYYWELSAALYSKDAERLESVFSKYDVKYILVDESVVSASNARALFIDEIKQLLGPSTKTFGKLSLWERPTDTNTFVKLVRDLPTVNAYRWTDNDVAYRDLGDYITIDQQKTASFEAALSDSGLAGRMSLSNNNTVPQTNTVVKWSGLDGNRTRGIKFDKLIPDQPEPTPDLVYPFRSLFTKRSVSEREFDPNQLLSLAVPVYDSTAFSDLSASAVKECGLLKNGKATALNANNFLRFVSLNQRGCLSFGIPDLSHRDGYLVAVESRHVEGRPLLFSLINETARHVELETYLSNTPDWDTSYFILPPLAPDGLGYNVYLSNDSIGRFQTVNDIRRIRIYQIPYDVLVHTKTGDLQPQGPALNVEVSHPNPAYYKISGVSRGTLILSQSYDPGWIAIQNNKILSHVLVNNWANGWTINPGANDTIYIFFWPQLLEFLGFALLPLPFLFLIPYRIASQ